MVIICQDLRRDYGRVIGDDLSWYQIYIGPQNGTGM